MMLPPPRPVSGRQVTSASVKLVQFELASAPGYARSGIVYGSKVYETDGQVASGVHELGDIVPLAPTGRPPSYRMFRAGAGSGAWLEGEGRAPFAYLNPGSLMAPNRAFPMPIFTDRLGYEPQLAVVVTAPAHVVSVEEADSLVLGITIANTFVARDLEDIERREGWGPGGSRDFATSIGPFLITPEELDDIVIDESRGRRYRLSATIRVNGEEVAREDLSDLPYTFAELIAFASETGNLAEGDLITFGPIGLSENLKPLLEPGDDVHVNIERIGVLVTRIT